MERYFTKFATDAAYTADANNLPNPNVSLIEAHGGIRCKKGITTVAAPVIASVTQTDTMGDNIITLSSTPGAEIKYFCWYLDDYTLNDPESLAPRIDNYFEYDQDAMEYYRNNIYEVDDKIDYIVNQCKDYIENELKLTTRPFYIYNPNNKLKISEFHSYDDQSNYYYRIFAIAHIGDVWSEMSILTPNVVGYWEPQPEEPPYEEPPYEEPYEEPYDEGGEP